MKTSAFTLALLSGAAPVFSSPEGSGSGSDSFVDPADAMEYVPQRGHECIAEMFTDASRFNLIEPCCEGDDKYRCPEYKQCRIADVADNGDVKCRCVAVPEKDDKCDADLLFKKTKECASDCKECRVSNVNTDLFNVECGCVDVGEQQCDIYAYDDCNYCRDEAPTPCENPAEGFEVSVCGDATYKVQTDDVAKICSGDGEAPTGDLCPKKGDMASEHCRADIWSFGFGPEGKCEAPEDAQCMKLKTTGAWGCVFPTNANEKRGCLSENVCTDEYKKVEGTDDLCQCTEAGYPIQSDTTSPDYINTTEMAKPSATVSYKTDLEGVATITNVLSLVAGMFATSLAIFASL